MKKNNKGFVLVETLVVSVAIAAIFSVIYTNIVPVLGEYEKVENYDDLDSKYIAHWMRMLVIKQGNNKLSVELGKLSPNSNNYFEIKKNKKETTEEKKFQEITNKCNQYFTNSYTCINFFKQFNITKFYIVPYNISGLTGNAGFKKQVKDDFGDYPGLQGYVDSLPKYNKGSKATNYYRIIVEVERNNDLKNSEDNYTTYATVEVNERVKNYINR